MTVEEKITNLETTYIKFMEKHNGYSDAGYVWWERIKDCQEWSIKERTYVPMSATKTLRTMRAWVKVQKSFI